MAVREYFWDFSDGPGTNHFHDLLSDGLTLTSDGGDIAHAWCDVFGTKRWVLDQPARDDGVVTGRLLSGSITYNTNLFTIMILMRWTGNMSDLDPGGASEGAIAVLDGDGAKFITTLSNLINWSNSRNTLLTNAQIPLGDFFVLTVTGNATRVKRYSNKTAIASDLAASTITLSNSAMRFIGYSEMAYRPKAQVAAIRFKVEAEYTEQEIFDIIDEWGFGSQPAKFNLSFVGDALGDMIGQGTLEIGGADVSHVLPGQTLGSESVVKFYSKESCNAQVIAMIRRGLGKIYVRYWFFLPTGITWIAGTAPTASPSISWGFIKIHRSTVSKILGGDGLNGAGIMASIFGVCDTALNTMKIEHVRYRPTAGGAETVVDTPVIRPTLDAWHCVDLIIGITEGTLEAKYDVTTNLIDKITGIAWDQSPVMVTYEQQYCNHIDDPYVHYGKDFSVGEYDPDITVVVNQASGQDDPTGNPSILFDVVFSRPVVDFGSSAVLLTGSAGASVASIAGSGAVYTISVSGMTDFGKVDASIIAGTVHDEIGFTNKVSTSTDNEVTYEGGSILNDDDDWFEEDYE